jgi:hypothetical protein
MADHGHDVSDDPSSGGTMDISEHVKMWHGFWNATKWGVIGCIAIAAILFIFRTHNGMY